MVGGTFGIGVVNVAGTVYVDVVEWWISPIGEEIDVAGVGALVVLAEAEFGKFCAVFVDGDKEVVVGLAFDICKPLKTESPQVSAYRGDHVEHVSAGSFFVEAQSEVLEVFELSDGIYGVDADMLAAFDLEAFEIGAER